MTPLLPLLLLAASAASGTPASQTWLARVNGEVVTVADLNQQFVKRHGGHTKFLSGEVEARKFLEIVIDQKLLVQEAYRLDLQAHPDVKGRVERFSEEKQVEHLLKTEIDERAQPTEAEIRTAWETHTTRLYTVLQIAAPTREDADKARARAAAGEDFEEVARETSIAPSRMFGGRLNGVGWGTFAPEWEGAVFSLKAGETTAVMETPQGFEIVRLESTRDVEKPDYDKARPRIESILKQRKLAERRRQFSDELWTKHGAQLTPVDVSLAGLQKTAVDAPDTVVATWNGGKLTAREIADDVKALRPGPAGERAWADQLRAIVNRPLAVLEAKTRGYEKVPSVAEAVQAREEELMEAILYADYVLKEVKVSEDEVRAWYDAHRAELTRPERRRIAQIVVADKDGAAALKQQIVDGTATFEDLAKTKSSDVQTAKNGGDLGWIEKKAVPEDLKAVLTLKDGEVSEPLATKYGVHLFKVTAVEAEKPLAYEEAAESVRKKLLEEHKRATRRTWVQQLRAAADVKINAKGIRTFVKEAEKSVAPPALPSGHGAQAPAGHGASGPHGAPPPGHPGS